MSTKNVELFPSEGAALVIGGTGGLGREISIQLAESGSNVALTYRRNESEAAKISFRIEDMGRKAMYEPLIIEELDSVKSVVEKAVKHFGRIHTVIYASGPDVKLGYFNRVTPEEWRRVIDIDVNGFFNMVYSTLPYLKESGKGGAYISVITVGVYKYPSRDVLSAVPKASVEMLTRAISREEGKFGIRANCVAPGMIESGLGARMLEEGLTPAVKEMMIHDISLRKLGEAEDIAATTVFLASSRAKHITGQTICVDGGWVNF